MNEMNDDLRYAWNEGYNAYLDSMPFDTCPYTDPLDREAWEAGWYDAKDDEK